MEQRPLSERMREQSGIVIYHNDGTKTVVGDDKEPKKDDAQGKASIDDIDEV